MSSAHVRCAFGPGKKQTSIGKSSSIQAWLNSLTTLVFLTSHLQFVSQFLVFSKELWCAEWKALYPFACEHRFIFTSCTGHNWVLSSLLLSLTHLLSLLLPLPPLVIECNGGERSQCAPVIACACNRLAQKCAICLLGDAPFARARCNLCVAESKCLWCFNPFLCRCSPSAGYNWIRDGDNSIFCSPATVRKADQTHCVPSSIHWSTSMIVPCLTTARLWWSVCMFLMHSLHLPLYPL